jgi:hypothetical protein
VLSISSTNPGGESGCKSSSSSILNVLEPVFKEQSLAIHLTLPRWPNRPVFSVLSLLKVEKIEVASSHFRRIPLQIARAQPNIVQNSLETVQNL